MNKADDVGNQLKLDDAGLTHALAERLLHFRVHDTGQPSYAIAQDLLSLVRNRESQPRDDASREQWRCFHCDESFTDREAAALHFGDFGPRSYTDAHCLIDATKLRELEVQLQRYQEEDGPIHRLMHRQAGEHSAALRRAEEAGYAKALKDTNYSGTPPTHLAESSGGDAVAAARWRALIGCGRMRVLGSAGLMVDRGHFAHLGLELWTQHEAGHEGPAVEWLTMFADKCIASGAEHLGAGAKSSR